MKRRLIRPGDELLDETIVVVRGGPLIRERIRQDAERAHRIYGDYAIWVFAADGVSVDELAQRTPLVRFSSLTLMTVGAIRAAGLSLRPTGRNRLHHSIEFRNLDDDVNRLLACDHRTTPNPYHEL